MTEDELLHYGVPGMRWGKRRENRLQTLQRVGSGTGTRRDNAKVALFEVSPQAVGRKGGLQGAAASKALGMEQRKARIQNGEAKARDVIAQLGGDRLIDAGRPEKRAMREAGKRQVDRILEDA